MPGIDVPYRLPQLADLDPAQLVAEDVDRAASRVGLGAAQAHERALARPVGTDERPPLARPDCEVDAGENLLRLADKVDVAKAQHLGRRAIGHAEADPGAGAGETEPTPPGPCRAASE